MIELPEIYNDVQTVLGEDGFAIPTNGVWYHGTSSALVDSIKENGLVRSGDKAFNQVAKQTMATIGNSYTEQREPVFLTQSKALAYFWAEQCVKRRSVRFEGEEQPVVLTVNLDDDNASKVRPDVGAAGLLMIKEGEGFMMFIASLYEQAGLKSLDIDLMKAEREEYLTKIGMAYIDDDILSDSISA
ncbi:MAG: hypothetical protein MK096_12005 [Oleiphilaceae bacterium]|nr:hypothetical protein [Oleiphilaceae bacterium]